MIGNTNKHSQGIKPIDEEAIKAALGGSDHAILLSVEEAHRNAQLTQLYPQETEIKGDFRHAPELEDIGPLREAVEPGIVNWKRIIALGLILSFPFVMLEWIFSLFMRPPSNEPLTIVATAAFYFVFALAMLIVLRRYLVQEFEKMNLTEGGQLFWSSVLFALPITQALRMPLSLQFEAGPIPDYLNLAIYTILFVVICTGALLGAVYIRYCSPGSENVRLAKLVNITILPYVASLIFIVAEVIR